jgi:hypothetical protein
MTTYLSIQHMLTMSLDAERMTVNNTVPVVRTVLAAADAFIASPMINWLISEPSNNVANILHLFCKQIQMRYPLTLSYSDAMQI